MSDYEYSSDSSCDEELPGPNRNEEIINQRAQESEPFYVTVGVPMDPTISAPPRHVQLTGAQLKALFIHEQRGIVQAEELPLFDVDAVYNVMANNNDRTNRQIDLNQAIYNILCGGSFSVQYVKSVVAVISKAIKGAYMINDNGCMYLPQPGENPGLSDKEEEVLSILAEGFYRLSEQMTSARLLETQQQIAIHVSRYFNYVQPHRIFITHVPYIHNNGTDIDVNMRDLVSSAQHFNFWYNLVNGTESDMIDWFFILAIYYNSPRYLRIDPPNQPLMAVVGELSVPIELETESRLSLIHI